MKKLFFGVLFLLCAQDRVEMYAAPWSARDIKEVARTFFCDKRVIAAGGFCIGWLFCTSYHRTAQRAVEVVPSKKSLQAQQNAIKQQDAQKIEDKNAYIQDLKRQLAEKDSALQRVQFDAVAACCGRSYAILAKQYQEVCWQVQQLNDIACQREGEMETLLARYKRLQLVLWLSGLEDVPKGLKQMRIACKWRKLAEGLVRQQEN